jgi:hypothetical protein
VLATGRCPPVRFNPVQELFMVFDIVRKADLLSCPAGFESAATVVLCFDFLKTETAATNPNLNFRIGEASIATYEVFVLHSASRAQTQAASEIS